MDSTNSPSDTFSSAAVAAVVAVSLSPSAVHPIHRCVDPRTVLPTVMGKMPRCNKRLRLTQAHLNSAEVRPETSDETTLEEG